MIRPATAADAPAILDLATSTGFFATEALAEFGQMIGAHLGGEPGADHSWIVDDRAGDDRPGLDGAAYFAPERMTDGTWNLYFLAVRSDRRRQGRGSALIRVVERAVAERRGRLLLVETSGSPDFEPAWACYRRAGFVEEAKIRDFYAAGDDKIIYRKALVPAAGTDPASSGSGPQ